MLKGLFGSITALLAASSMVSAQPNPAPPSRTAPSAPPADASPSWSLPEVKPLLMGPRPHAVIYEEPPPPKPARPAPPEVLTPGETSRRPTSSTARRRICRWWACRS